MIRSSEAALGHLSITDPALRDSAIGSGLGLAIEVGLPLGKVPIPQARHIAIGWPWELRKTPRESCTDGEGRQARLLASQCVWKPLSRFEGSLLAKSPRKKSTSQSVSGGSSVYVATMLTATSGHQVEGPAIENRCTCPVS